MKVWREGHTNPNTLPQTRDSRRHQRKYTNHSMRNIDQLVLRGCLLPVSLINVESQNGGCRNQLRTQAGSAGHEQADQEGHSTALPSDSHSGGRRTEPSRDLRCSERVRVGGERRIWKKKKEGRKRSFVLETFYMRRRRTDRSSMPR
jgi:hypothetical protein